MGRGEWQFVVTLFLPAHAEPIIPVCQRPCPSSFGGTQPGFTRESRDGEGYKDLVGRMGSVFVFCLVSHTQYRHTHTPHPHPVSVPPCVSALLCYGVDIDDKAKEIVYRNYVDVSVAVSSPNGLVVPVLRNVEDMGESDTRTNHVVQIHSFRT